MAPLTLEDFLALRGTELQSVVDAVDNQATIGPADSVFAVGSLAEGLATEKSDLDLIVLKADGQGPPSNMSLVVGRCLVDIRVVSLSEFEQLLERFRTWAGMTWDVTTACEFDIEDRTLIHRIANGRVLRSELGSRQGQLLNVRDLARLKLQVARHAARTTQADLVGYRVVRDYASLVFASQRLLCYAVDALLAGHLVTNPQDKWRCRLLGRLPLDWERPLLMRPTGYPAADRFWELHRAPLKPEREASLLHAHRTLAFARPLFLWAEQELLDMTDESNIGPMRWRQSKVEPSDGTLPYLDYDVDFLVREGRAMLGRLNEFERPVTVSLGELGIALLFDGKTSHHEANSLALASGQRFTEDGMAEDLLRRLAEARLCAPDVR